jgi:hypothetical protein
MPNKAIVFTGRISDEKLHRLYGQASVVASASDHEAFGLVVTEGIASGARVIASDIPAHAELAEMAGRDAPITLLDVRDSQKLAKELEQHLLKGRVANEKIHLPTWPDFVHRVREVYLRINPSVPETDHDETLASDSEENSRLTLWKTLTEGSL